MKKSHSKKCKCKICKKWDKIIDKMIKEQRINRTILLCQYMNRFKQQYN
jgi:hypothetical protein